MASVHVGVVGLGAGTLASYGRSGDQYRFYEINPTVIDIAYSYFSYLKMSRAKVDVISGDARLSLERETSQQFDVLVIDEFSGDSIPVHLLARAAFREDIRHLAPDGLLAIHVSNQYLNLAPIVKLAADGYGMKTVLIENDEDEDRGVDQADWVIVTTNQQFLKNPEVSKAVGTIKIPTDARAWTDDFSSVIPILQ